MTFDDAFDRVLGHEGAYSNNSADPGMETMWGITRKVALQSGYAGEMRVLPRDFAKEIYRREYWARVRADDMPDFWRFHVFDAAVNSGVTQAIRWLQRAVDVADDGVFGPATLAAVQASTKEALLRFYGERLDLLTSLPTWAAFGRGWARRCASNLLNT